MRTHLEISKEIEKATGKTSHYCGIINSEDIRYTVEVGKHKDMSVIVNKDHSKIIQSNIIQYHFESAGKIGLISVRIENESKRKTTSITDDYLELYNTVIKAINKNL